MIGWLLRATVSLLVLGLCAYTVVAVPIGRRTLFEHGIHIARTKPAKELADDVATAAAAAVDRARTAFKYLPVQPPPFMD
jgi:hypothetical protein